MSGPLEGYLNGKVTIIKSLVIPKFVYLASLMSTPNNVMVELNRLLYKFLWNGMDKVTRLSTRNEFEKGGLRMIDLVCMIKVARNSFQHLNFDGPI